MEKQAIEINGQLTAAQNIVEQVIEDHEGSLSNDECISLSSAVSDINDVRKSLEEDRFENVPLEDLVIAFGAEPPQDGGDYVEFKTEKRSGVVGIKNKLSGKQVKDNYLWHYGGKYSQDKNVKKVLEEGQYEEA